MLQICCELPLSIKKSLTRLCFGLPDAQWVNENDFLLTLKSFPPLSSSAVHDLQEELFLLSSPPLTLQLSGIGCHKNSHPSIWIKPTPSETLDLLCRKLERVSAPYHPIPQPPHVLLATFPKSSLSRLGNYLETFHFFLSESFDIHSFVLSEVKITGKSRILEIEGNYPLTKEFSEGMQ